MGIILNIKGQRRSSVGKLLCNCAPFECGREKEVDISGLRV